MHVLFFKFQQFRDTNAGIYKHEYYSHIFVAVYIIPNFLYFIITKRRAVYLIWIARGFYVYIFNNIFIFGYNLIDYGILKHLP